MALRYGVIVQRKATMRYSAHVTHHSTKPNCDAPLAVEVEAADDFDAVRQVADFCARSAYGPEGAVAYVQKRDDNSFLANIGTFEFNQCNGVTRGCAITIRLRAVE